MIRNSGVIIDSKNLGDEWNEEIVLAEPGKEWSGTAIFTERLPRAVRLAIRLIAPRTRVDLVIAYLGKGQDATDMDITVMHEAPETYARVTARAALYDEARFTFRGLLDIKKGGIGADSYLSAKALLLSEKARAEIYPYLEIKTDAVKASHGSSIGRIDPETLFYLQSRGMKKHDAERVVLNGFFGDLSGLTMHREPL
ncbi:MAG: SufD family Fe-S cluster assembly protein [Patescibacteria group bacterium]|mgnify:CR=1 FL=1